MAPRHWLMEEMQMRRGRTDSQRQRDNTHIVTTGRQLHHAIQPNTSTTTTTTHLISFHSARIYDVQTQRPPLLPVALLETAEKHIYTRSVNTTCKHYGLQPHNHNSLPTIQSPSLTPSMHTMSWSGSQHALRGLPHTVRHQAVHTQTHIHQGPQKQHYTRREQLHIKERRLNITGYIQQHQTIRWKSQSQCSITVMVLGIQNAYFSIISR